MKSHKETKSKIQPPTNFCVHHKLSHSNMEPKQTALHANNTQPKRLSSPSKKPERPLTFSSATIESTNKNIQKDKVCHRANLLRSRSALTSHLKRDKYRNASEVDEISPRRKPMEEFEKKKKILRMKKLLEDFEQSRTVRDLEQSRPVRESKVRDFEQTQTLDRHKVRDFDTLPERSRRFNTCKQIRSKSEPRASPKTILFDIVERESEPSMATSMSSSKAIVCDTGKFDMVRKFFEEPSLKRCYSMSSIKQPPVNKYSIIFKNSSKFKDLHNFFRNLEKLNELKRSTSCVDVRPIRKEADLIDYDVWRSTHDNVKSKRKFESLYAQVKEMEKAKHFVYECSNASKNKWRKDEDFGLRNRIRTITDLRKIFTSVNGNDESGHKNNQKSLEHDELFKKHGVSNCLIRMLTNTQMNKLRKQLTEIYQENILENNKNSQKQLEMRNNKNKLIVKPLFANRDLNIKNKIQYYENKLYCVPPGNTIYRAKSDLEQEEEAKNAEKERKTEDYAEFRKLPSRQSSKSISCLVTDTFPDKETDNRLKRSFHDKSRGGYNKSMSIEDLSTLKNNMNEAKRNSQHKSVLKSNKSEIYERLNAFILKKLENMNGSSKKYQKSNINIHYDTPVLLEEKDYIPEKILAHQQANHMVKVYEETRKNKILKEKAANESRRHTDNFTANQKAPSLMLHRYDDDNIMNTVNYKVAKAIHDFNGYNKNELSFKKGDILMLYKKVDHNWYDGQICGKRGLIPFSYVEVLSKPTKKEFSNVTSAVAKFNFKAESKVELNLNKGDIVLISRRIDQNWYEGQIEDRKGIFPCSYVYVFNEDELETFETPQLRPVRAIEQPKVQQIVQRSARDNAYRVLYSYKPKNADELELKEGDIVHVLETCDDGWFIGAVGNRFGTFPGNYVEKL